MQEIKYKMIRYMGVEQLSESTIGLYSRVYDKIFLDVKYFENRGNSFWIEYLANIPDAINRNNYRSVILKACRDVLGENIRLPNIHKPFKLQPIYSIEEVSRIFARIKNPKHYAIACMIFTESMRVNEVLSIRLSDCNKADGSVVLRDTKTNKDFKKYLDLSTIDAIRKYFIWVKANKEQPKILLFEGVGNHKYSATSVRMFMRKAMLLSGLDIRGSCHVFRRSASVWKIESGWTANHIAASLNNSVKTVNKYYAYARPEYIAKLPKPIPLLTSQIKHHETFSRHAC